MVVTCAWCGNFIRAVENDPGMRSHGICKPCAERMKAEAFIAGNDTVNPSTNNRTFQPGARGVTKTRGRDLARPGFFQNGRTGP